jgi:hypothetical protein
MSALEASIVVVLAVLPWYWLVQRELAKLEDRDYLRAHGVVIVSPTALQGHSAAIGHYLGRPIWGSVTFMGMEYRFDHVAPRSARERLGPRELFLDPGLVYVTV